MCIVIAAALCGCGDNMYLVAVSGIVTLDGKPLANARVLFRPAVGRPSSGMTGSDGSYSLHYTADRPGVLAGDHLVSISTATDEDADGGRGKELIPARYNSKTTLRVSVDSSHPTQNFALETK